MTGSRVSGPAPVERVMRFIADPQGDTFDAAASAVFAFQFEKNAPYRKLCESRGITPGSLRRWQDAPAVPTEAFRHRTLSCGEPRRVFRTSGTTGERGTHALPDDGVYRASWREPFRRHLLPDRARIDILSLIHSEAELPDSSLSFMAARVLETFGGESSVTAMSGSGMDSGLVRSVLRSAETGGEPLLILTTAFAAVHLLDRLAAGGESYRLPPGSRVMDTGGFKGRSREVTRADLLEGYAEILGIDTDHVVGEYGMTELCSQWYEPVLADRHSARGPARPRAFAGPPWARVRILNPDTLMEAAVGERGLIAPMDLANVWTVSSILTQDIGRMTEHGLLVEGRAREAELRGCSLTVEEILG